MKDFKVWFYNYFTAPFSWSRWVDIDTFSFGGNAFLLQGKVNSKSNAKKFRVTASSNKTANIHHISIKALHDCGLIEDKVIFNKKGN